MQPIYRVHLHGEVTRIWEEFWGNNASLSTWEGYYTRYFFPICAVNKYTWRKLPRAGPRSLKRHQVLRVLFSQIHMNRYSASPKGCRDPNKQLWILSRWIMQTRQVTLTKSNWVNEIEESEFEKQVWDSGRLVITREAAFQLFTTFYLTEFSNTSLQLTVVLAF